MRPSKVLRMLLYPALSIVALSIFSTAAASVRLPRVFGAKMVLQQQAPIQVWGWADAGEKVTVKISENEKSTTADANGEWRVTLPAMPAGGPYEMTVTASNKVSLSDVLVGEVWLCSGQSNMEWNVESSADGPQEVAAANYPQIRLFQISHSQAGQPMPDVEAEWKPCRPDTVKGFSGVGYFFGRELHKQLNVPVGLINASWGGTRIEPWTPPVGFTFEPSLKFITEQVEKADAQFRSQLPGDIARLEKWKAETKTALDKKTEIPMFPRWPSHPLVKPAHPTEPTVLYNAMIHPIVPFAIKGAIWYQGEAHIYEQRGPAMLYHDKMKGLIKGWRKVWNEGEFPFYFVGLAPFRYQAQVSPTMLPEVWEAQAAILGAVPHAGMAVIVDIGNVADIHPRNKQDVGKRLALWALAKDYGKNVEYSGPVYKSKSIEGNKIRLKFDHIGTGLVSRNGKPLTWFEIAGADKKFVKAKAEIDGETVLVSSEEVAAPVAVRFAWNQEAEPNLSNKEGLPAWPFRTEKW